MMSDDLLTTLIQGYDRYQTLAARDWSSLKALAVQTVEDFWSVLLAANDGHLVPLAASPHGTKLYHWRAGWRQTYTSTASASSMISAWISEDLSLTVSIAGESIFMERWDHATQTYPHLTVVAEKWNHQLELLGSAQSFTSSPCFPSPADAVPASSLPVPRPQLWEDVGVALVLPLVFILTGLTYGLAVLLPTILTLFHGHF